MIALRASKVEIQTVGSTIERVSQLEDEMQQSLVSREARAIADVDVRRWVAKIGRLQVGIVMRLASAIWASREAANETAPSRADVRRLYRKMLQTALRDPIDLGSLAIDGDDLRRSGIPPGPALGKILSALLDDVIKDPSHNTADWLLQEAKAIHAASG